MTRQHKQFAFFAFILVGFPIVVDVVNYFVKKRALESKFSGRIEKLRFGDKGTAVVMVNMKSIRYFIPAITLNQTL